MDYIAREQFDEINSLLKEADAKLQKVVTFLTFGYGKNTLTRWGA